MNFKTKAGIFLIIMLILSAAGLFIYLKYFFTYEQRNKVKRQIETITGQNLTITVFDVNGKIIKRWTGVQKLTSGEEYRNYIFFYDKDGKYVQIPNSVWYIAEEE
ncbi:MAG: hypothetical protein JW982_05550 [Spirochaetes bacterium]|nr:hypothetical protein [Spirochaetota bacterium]